LLRRGRRPVPQRPPHEHPLRHRRIPVTEQPEKGTAEVVKRLAFAAAEPTEVHGGNMYAFVTDGQVHHLDLTGDQYLDFPRRKRGTVTVRNAASFAHYYAKH